MSDAKMVKVDTAGITELCRISSRRLCRGEERQLTDSEVATINSAIRESLDAIRIVDDLYTIAVVRFIKDRK